MSQIKVRRPQTKAQAEAQAGPVTQAQVNRQLAWAVGSEAFTYRDPLFHITESFQMTFDRMGRQHAASLDEESSEQNQEAQSRETQNQEAQSQEEQVHENHNPASHPTGMRNTYRRRNPAQQVMLRKFSEMAFSRGTLSAAVLRGTGKMMLFSCLKRTVAQSQPKLLQQHKLFEGSSLHWNVPGRMPDKVVFNRTFTDSAVGLVVDTLKDARRTVETMTALARGSGAMGPISGVDTLRRMYPFLDDSSEKALLTQYREQLRTCTGVEERQVLQSALVRTRAVAVKKAQIRHDFMVKLRLISDRATEALQVFETPRFAQSLHQAVEESFEGEPSDGDIPPEDGDGKTPQNEDMPPEYGGGNEPPDGDIPPEDGDGERESDGGTDWTDP